MPESGKSRGRGAKNSRQREELILALLQQPSLEKAAESMQISRVTAWRISKTPEFQQEYRQARREAIAQCQGRLQQACSAAATTLLKIMIDPNAPAASRVQAAHRVLAHATASLQAEDLQVRVERLEQIAQEKENHPQPDEPGNTGPAASRPCPTTAPDDRRTPEGLRRVA